MSSSDKVLERVFSRPQIFGKNKPTKHAIGGIVETKKATKRNPCLRHATSITLARENQHF
jgi:hypothetical protein